MGWRVTVHTAQEEAQSPRACVHQGGERGLARGIYRSGEWSGPLVPHLVLSHGGGAQGLGSPSPSSRCALVSFTPQETWTG